MILHRIWGLYTHPSTEWHSIDHQRQGLKYSLVHLALIALIPATCLYISAALIGWNLGQSATIVLGSERALIMATSLYLFLVIGVLALAYLVFWMAKTFGARAHFDHSLELAAYAATPVFMTGIALFYPVPVFVMLVVLAGIGYSVYLLYSGIPIVMKVSKDKSFIYTSSVITAALVLLLCIIVAAILLWSWSFAPWYMY